MNNGEIFFAAHTASTVGNLRGRREWQPIYKYLHFTFREENSSDG